MDPAALRAMMAGMQGAAAPPKPLVSFKAGMMKDKLVPGDSTRLSLKADVRSGDLVVTRPPPGQAPQLQWRDRATGSPLWERMVFPGDISFRRILSPTASDRVYELCFVATRTRTFFYMQDADVSKDGDRVRDMLGAVDNPTGAAAAADRAARLVAAGEEGSGSALNLGGLQSRASAAPAASFDLSSILGMMAPSPQNVSGTSFTGASSGASAAQAPGSSAAAASTPAAHAAATQAPPSAVAFESSMAASGGAASGVGGGGIVDDEEEELRKAMELSMMEDAEAASAAPAAAVGGGSSSSSSSSEAAAATAATAATTASPPPAANGGTGASGGSSSSSSSESPPPPKPPQ